MWLELFLCKQYKDTPTPAHGRAAGGLVVVVILVVPVVAVK
jgi:hypothetical protein